MEKTKPLARARRRRRPEKNMLRRESEAVGCTLKEKNLISAEWGSREDPPAESGP